MRFIIPYFVDYLGKRLIDGLGWLTGSAPMDLSVNIASDQPVVPVEVVTKSWIIWKRTVPAYSRHVIKVELPDCPEPQPTQLDFDEALPGDVLLGVRVGRKASIGDYAIQTLTRGAITHAAIVGEGGKVHEAIPKGVSTCDIQCFVKKYSYVVVLRPYGIDQCVRENISAFLASAKGKYSIVDAIKAATRDIHKWRKNSAGAREYLRRLLLPRTRERYICSDFVRAALVKGGLPDFSTKGRVSTPSDFVNIPVGPLLGFFSDTWPIELHRYDTSSSISLFQNDYMDEIPDL